MSFSDAKSVNWLRGPAEQNHPREGRRWGGAQEEGTDALAKFPGELKECERNCTEFSLLQASSHSSSPAGCLPEAYTPCASPLASQQAALSWLLVSNYRTSQPAQDGSLGSGWPFC